MTDLPAPPANPLTFERSIEVRCSPERLFEFHRDTRNAQLVSPGTKFLSVDGSFPLDVGDVFTIRFIQAPLPVPVTWSFLVERMERNRLIVDVALRAPFPYWRHEHMFEPIDDERTRLTDRVTFLPPLGAVGRIGQRMVGRILMDRLFAARHRATKRLMEAGHDL